MVDPRRNTPEHFEKLGPEKVRFLLSRHGVDETFSAPAVDWLADYDKKEKDQQSAIARSGKRAAWLAAWLAFLAVVISLCAWLFPTPPINPSQFFTRSQNVKTVEAQPATSTAHSTR